jgi:hypothetical protein
MTPTGEVPLAFRQYRELFKIHITHILTLEGKTPIHTVPLLVTVACEVFARLLGYGKGGAERVFYEELSWPSNITRPMTRRLFDVLRNGLAHAYGPYPFILQGGERVRVTMTWKAGPHLRIIGVKIEGVHARIVAPSESELPGKWLCVDVESLWEMLKAGFEKIADRVKADPKLARTIEKNARKLLKARPAGGDETEAAAEWQAFLEAAVYTPGASAK